MASALRQAVRNKLTPEQAAWVNQHYAAYGATPEERYQAYDRRQGREQYARAQGWGDNFTLNHASGQQVAALNRQGLIGGSGSPAVQLAPSGPPPLNQGTPFGQGAGKVPPMVAPMMGPGPGGSPTPGRPIAPPVMAGPAQQFTPQTSLGMAMSGAVRDFSVPRNKRRTFGTYGG